MSSITGPPRQKASSSAMESYASHILNNNNNNNNNNNVDYPSDSFSSPLSAPSLSSPPSFSTSLSSSSSPPSSLYELTEMIREFWSAFPCPPPWRPRLLAETNATARLEPNVGRQVHSFLAGKCRLQHVSTGADLHPAGGLDLRGGGGGGFFGEPTGSGDVGVGGVLIPDQAPSPHADRSSWCDSGCKVALGCAVILAMVMVLVGILVYLTRHRRTSKMAAARPSRQQLQMSTSVSDTVNCTDFSNLEVQTDDEAGNPFRFRGLPHPPPSLCVPFTFDPHHPKWGHSNCSTFQPMIRMGPAGEYYSYAYSAVYETIDDDEDDDEHNKGTVDSFDNCPMMGQASRDLSTRQLTSSFQPMSILPCGCSPFQHLSTNHDRCAAPEIFPPAVSAAEDNDPTQLLQTGSGGQFANQCLCDTNIVIANQQAEAETEFNGSDQSKSCASRGQKAGEPRSGFQPLNDVTDRKDRAYKAGKQEVEKSSDYCSDVSCMSVGSVSSRNGAIESPSSLSGYTNDFTFTSECRDRYDTSAGSSSKLGGSDSTSAGSKNQGITSSDAAQAARPSTISVESSRPGQLIISSPSAFHPPQCLTHGQASSNKRSSAGYCESEAPTDFINKNNLVLKAPVFSKDSGCHGNASSLHSPAWNENVGTTGKGQVFGTNIKQKQVIVNQQYHRHPQHHNHHISHSGHHCQQRQQTHPHHHNQQHHSQSRILCHVIPSTASSAPNPTTLTATLPRPVPTHITRYNRAGGETNQMTPCSANFSDPGQQLVSPSQDDALAISESSPLYSNTDALLSCNLNESNLLAPASGLTNQKCLSPCGNIALPPPFPYRTTEIKENQEVPFPPPPLCAAKDSFMGYTDANSDTTTNRTRLCGTAVDDVGLGYDSSGNVSDSVKKPALALHSQYFEKTSPN